MKKRNRRSTTVRSNFTLILGMMAAVIVESGRSSIPEPVEFNREAAAYWIPAFAGYDSENKNRKSSLSARTEKRCVVELCCHRPRKRAIQYSRASRVQSRSRGVLDTPLARGMTVKTKIGNHRGHPAGKSGV